MQLIQYESQPADRVIFLDGLLSGCQNLSRLNWGPMLVTRIWSIPFSMPAISPRPPGKGEDDARGTTFGNAMDGGESCDGPTLTEMVFNFLPRVIASNKPPVIPVCQSE